MRKPATVETVAALFSRFRAIWPRAWADIMRTAPDPATMAAEWAFALAGATQAQLNSGIAQCRDRLPWPPSIAEFRAACGIADELARTGGYVRTPRTPPRAPGAAQATRGHLRVVRSVRAEDGTA